jgi:23S rRNA pseudouridine1911/1915/1917 synthase
MSDAPGQRHLVTPDAGEAGGRIDQVLTAHLPRLSRSRLKSLIEQGHLSSGGAKIVEPAYRVKPGQTFAIFVPEAIPARPVAQAIALDIVFEDPDLIVLDKPAGLVVHPAPGNPDRTLVNALIAHCEPDFTGIGGVRRPGIVHRLDKDTSGLMVVAKTAQAYESLAGLFAARSVERAYWALVWGVPSPRSGEIEGNIGRSPRNRKKMAVVKRGGKPAVTRYKVLQSFADGKVSLVECRLLSGRTHQIRVHMTSIGHPLLGDPLYGRCGGSRLGMLPAAAEASIKGLGRQALHAKTLGFRHPGNGGVCRFDSVLPPDMRGLITILESL